MHELNINTSFSIATLHPEDYLCAARLPAPTLKMSNMENLLSFHYCQAPINHITLLLPTAANSKITLDEDQAFISIDLLRANPKFMNLNHSTLQEHLTPHYQKDISPTVAITFYSQSLHLFTG